MNTSVWLTTICAGLCACGFGHSLVGIELDRSPPGASCNVTAQDCDSVINFAALSPPAAPVLDLMHCGNVGTACDTPGIADGCDVATAIVSNGEASGPREASCASLSFSVAPSVTQLSLSDLMATRSSISFSAPNAVSIDLVRPSFDGVQIELSGPITLRISTTTMFRSVSISDLTGQGQQGASLDLRDSTAALLGVVGLRGQAMIERSTLDTAGIFASTVDLEVVTANVVDVSTTELFGTEIKGEVFNIETEHAVISASTFTKLQLQKCDTVLFGKTLISNSRLGACSTMMRNDQVGLTNSLVGGPVESLSTIYQGVTFGPGVPTTVVSWQDNMLNNRFCAPVTKVTLGEPPSMWNCNDCTETVPNPAQLFCRVPDPETTGDTSMTDKYTQTYANCPEILHPADCSPAPVNYFPMQ